MITHARDALLICNQIQTAAGVDFNEHVDIDYPYVSNSTITRLSSCHYKNNIYILFFFYL